MKKYIKLLLLLITITLCSNAGAQALHPQTVAVCKSGILFNKVKIKKEGKIETPYTVMDTISLEDAQSITAFSIIDFDKNKNIQMLKLISFEFMVDDNGVSYTMESTSTTLTDEMRGSLAAMKSGTILYFKEIRALYPNGDFAYSLPLTLVAR